MQSPENHAARRGAPLSDYTIVRGPVSTGDFRYIGGRSIKERCA
jgi:hypothetical protein